MHIALAQFDAGPDVAENVDTAERYVREAAAEGADLVVLPEIWNVGYFAFDEYEAGAETLDGPTVSRLGSLAADLGIHVHGGSIVERDGEDLYNTSLLFGPDGTLLDTYRKVHLFGYESEESRILTPGERVVTVETSLGTVGLTTCYDLRFPELYRALVDQGAELLLVSSAWPRARLDHWQLFTRARAVEEQVILAAANLVGDNRGVTLGGNSVVVDPWGTPRANAGSESRIASARVDIEEVSAAREEFPALADRRMNLSYDL
ncbi:MAG: carbon-nitrogen family hydrolase [Salinigranum sp.]